MFGKSACGCSLCTAVAFRYLSFSRHRLPRQSSRSDPPSKLQPELYANGTHTIILSYRTKIHASKRVLRYLIT